MRLCRTLFQGSSKTTTLLSFLNIRWSKTGPKGSEQYAFLQGMLGLYFILFLLEI